MKKAKLLKAIGVFLCAVGLVFIGHVAWHLVYSASSVTCLESRPEDSYQFGAALAINDNYIAVGDPQANRVTIYNYDESKDKWSRTREIYPPDNSIINRVGYGFGSSLVFHQNQLIIGAYSGAVRNNFGQDNEVKNSKSKYSYHGAVYSLVFDEERQNILSEIELPESIKLTGYSITIFSNKIAIEATTGSKPGQKPNKVLIVNPTTLKVEAIIEPPILPTGREYAGTNIAGNKRSLIIFSPYIPTLGGVYFANEQGELIETISMSEIYPSETKRFSSPVELADDFMAINSGGWTTSIFRQSSNGWSKISSVDLFGSLSAVDSQLLISAGRYPFDKGTQTKIPNHSLVDLQDDKAFVRSEIRWQRGILFGPAKGLYYGPAKAQGVINSQYLLLAKNGEVVLLKKNYLPRDYVISRLFCKEK